jgi:predicted nucleotidyltransferase component of viral defense system
MRKRIVDYQKRVLRELSGKIDDFYLVGGTALALFYFQHRLSVDLDFFTPVKYFSHKRIEEIVALLKAAVNKPISLTAQNLNKKQTRMMIYNIHFTKQEALKMDFVEDVFPMLTAAKVVDGVRVLSLEDIYLRKLYAICGVLPVLDEIGHEHFVGGRAAAKDFYDLFYLSHTFMPLSKFVVKYGNRQAVQGVITWFHSYDRMAMMDGVLNLNTTHKPDCKVMEKHFTLEVDKIVGKEIEGV